MRELFDEAIQVVMHVVVIQQIPHVLIIRTFNDVAIEFAGLTMRTDYLQVKEGKLTFNPINITDKNGELLAVYEGRK